MYIIDFLIKKEIFVKIIRYNIYSLLNICNVKYVNWYIN